MEKYAHRYKFLSQISSDRSGVVAARQWNRRPHWVSFRIRRVVGGRAALVEVEDANGWDGPGRE